ncbi:MAG: glycosyltransferase family 4 protein [Pyrinomonadaceae bacterium]
MAFASYPVQAAATRYRLVQFTGALSERGITLSILPFLDAKLFESLYKRNALPRTALGLLGAGLLRLKDVLAARRADVVLIQREAMIFGPPVIEWLCTQLNGRPMVLDLDDATYVPYTSPTFGRLGKGLKWFSKTDDLIDWATLVTCGNRAIAEYVASKGGEPRVIPTVVDTDIFHPVPRSPEPRRVVLGWVGTHSTFPYLESIFPVLEEIARTREFRLKIVGAGGRNINIPGVQVENLGWRLDREVEDFQSFDIGLYPIDASLYAEKWAAGKSGFKAIQYMAVGIPYVTTPVGATKEIGEVGKTHFCALTAEEWSQALSTLIAHGELREKMGTAGRQHVIEHYGLAAQADKLAQALRDAAETSKS